MLEPAPETLLAALVEADLATLESQREPFFAMRPFGTGRLLIRHRGLSTQLEPYPGDLDELVQQGLLRRAGGSSTIPAYDLTAAGRTYYRDHIKPGQSPERAVVDEMLNVLDSQHAREAWAKALSRRAADPDGAITAARTMFEATCKALLEKLGEPVPANDNLPSLYAKVSDSLKLAPSKQTDDALRRILGSVTNAVSGLAELRDKAGDAHGPARAAIRPDVRHATLAVNLAGAITEFLIATWQAQQP